MPDAVNHTQNRRSRLIKIFFWLLIIAVVGIWQIFSGYSESSLIKKEKYLLEFDLNGLKDGDIRIIQQTGLPLIIMRRSTQDLRELLKVRSYLTDPDSLQSAQPKFAKNYHRSLKPEFFIAFAISPEIGRDINYRLKQFKPKFVTTDHWFGGFSQQQTDVVYDKAGRSYKPKGINLHIPNYRITPQNKLYVYTLKELNFD